LSYWFQTRWFLCECHSAVALLLKAALIQVSDYRLLGASGLFSKLNITPNVFQGAVVVVIVW
jgi:hypothetical protein